MMQVRRMMRRMMMMMRVRVRVRRGRAWSLRLMIGVVRVSGHVVEFFRLARIGDGEADEGEGAVAHQANKLGQLGVGGQGDAVSGIVDVGDAQRGGRGEAQGRLQGSQQVGEGHGLGDGQAALCALSAHLDGDELGRGRGGRRGHCRGRGVSAQPLGTSEDGKGSAMRWRCLF